MASQVAARGTVRRPCHNWEWNFRDVVALLLASEAAIVVRNQDELETFVRRCLTDGDFAAALGHRARQLVIEQQGAADRTLALLESLLPPNGARQGRAA